MSKKKEHLKIIANMWRFQKTRRIVNAALKLRFTLNVLNALVVTIKNRTQNTLKLSVTQNVNNVILESHMKVITRSTVNPWTMVSF